MKPTLSIYARPEASFARTTSTPHIPLQPSAAPLGMWPWAKMVGEGAVLVAFFVAAFVVTGLLFDTPDHSTAIRFEGLPNGLTITAADH